MIEVTFYKFQKKSNSTKIPSGTFKKYSCVLKDDTSIINPVLEIHENDKPFEYNYCYIPEFKRYYKINDWSYYESVWTASCSVDVLASFKNYIGESNLYILRSASNYDGNILDSYYPSTSRMTFSTVKKDPVFPSSVVGSDRINSTLGCYILGIVSKGADFGSISYRLLSSFNMKLISSYLLDSAVTPENGFDLADASMELQKNIINPLQYIKSCVWFPFPYSTLKDVFQTSETNVLNIYSWTVNTYNKIVTTTTNLYSISFNIPKHPQTNERGNYLNLSPYTAIRLYYPPFGIIDIDTTMTVNASTIKADLIIDFITGDGILKVYVDNRIHSTLNGQIGVNINLSEVSSDILGTASTAVKSTGGFFSNLLRGDVVGAVTGGVSGAIDTYSASIPKATSIGSNGGFSSLLGSPELQCQFYHITDEDIDHAGRPLCSNRKINALNGYILCRDGEIQAPATSDELEMISSYLTGGFFYE